MDENEQPPQPPQRSSLGLALLAGLAVVVSAVGALLYNASQSGEKSTVDYSGFDVAKVEEAKRVSAAPSQQQASSLGMIGGGAGLSMGEVQKESASSAPGSPAAPTSQEDAFTKMCRDNEMPLARLTKGYVAKYPILKQYAKEWASHPDLKKLNDDWKVKKDPIAFIRGLAVSPTFPGLVKKYAREPGIQAYAKDVITRAPNGMISMGMAMAKKEQLVNRLADNVMSALGLPRGMFDPGATPKATDQNQIMNSVMNNNPDVQKAMGGLSGVGAMMNNPAISGALKNNPEAMKKLQDNPDAAKLLGGGQ